MPRQWLKLDTGLQYQGVCTAVQACACLRNAWLPLQLQLTIHHLKAKLGPLRQIFHEVLQLARYRFMAAPLASRGEANCVQVLLIAEAESSCYIVQENVISKHGAVPHNA